MYARSTGCGFESDEAAPDLAGPVTGVSSRPVIGGAGIVRVVWQVRQVVMILFPWILDAAAQGKSGFGLHGLKEVQHTFDAHSGIMSWYADSIAALAE